MQLAFWKAARHVPVNFMFFDDTADLEKNIYVATLQIAEDFRRAEEDHGPRGWNLCKVWAKGHALQQHSAIEPNTESAGVVPAEDSIARTADLLSQVKYGSTCEYVDAKTRKVLSRTVGDACWSGRRAGTG